MESLQKDHENIRYFLEQIYKEVSYYEINKEISLLKSNFITHKIFCYNLRNEFREFKGLFEEVEK